METKMSHLCKAVCLVSAAFAIGSVQAVTVSTVEELVKALEKDQVTEVVLKAGVTFDVSSLTPRSPKETWGGTVVDTKLAYLLYQKSGVVRGEDPTHWSLKTPAQESVIKCDHATARLLYPYSGGRNGKYMHITFDGGNAGSEAGGGLYFLGPSIGYATNCVFRNCTGAYGGGTHCVTAYDCFYTNCTATTATNGGGGAYGEGNAGYNSPTNSFLNSTFVGCSSAAYGGAIYMKNWTCSEHPTAGRIDGCVFSNCTAATSGGAVYAQTAGLVRNCGFAGNQASNGGALYVEKSRRGLSVVSNCTFTGNTAVDARYGAGGAVFGWSNVVDSVFTANTAAYRGGAVINVENLVGSTLTSNAVKLVNDAWQNDLMYGGAAADCGKSIGCAFIGNVSPQQGGAVCYVPCSNCTFIANSATKSGGAAYGSVVDGSTFVSNFCIKGGGGGCAYCRPVRNSFFTGNTSGNDDRGGALRNCTAESCVFSNNYCATAARGGAAAFSDCFDCRFGGYGDVSVGSYTRCVFDGVIKTNGQTWVLNSLHWGGGPIGITNCLITHCQVSSLVAAEGNDASVVNCTFADNVLAGQWDNVIRGVAGQDYAEKTPEGKYATYPGSSTYVNCLFSGNTRSNGNPVDLYVDFVVTTDHGENHIALSNCFYTTGLSIPAGVVTNAIICGNAKFNAGKFEDAPYYTLQHASKARNAGLAMPWMDAATDLAGNPRLLEAKPDIGCYESVLPGFGLLLMLR